jgi:hypothetical protein
MCVLSPELCRIVPCVTEVGSHPGPCRGGGVRGGGLRTRDLVVLKAGGLVVLSVAGRRVLPFWPRWGGLVQACVTLLMSWSVSAC